MADSILTDLSEETSPATNDWLYIVDRSDTTDNAAGSSAKIQTTNLLAVGDSRTATLTNKTIDLTDNTVTGTKAEFDTACSDGDFAYSGDAPSSHAASHQSGGGDAIKLDDLAAPDDNTDLDASGSAHGLMPKADKTKLDGIESAATADQTDAEIETAYNNQVAAASQAEAEAGTETAIRRFSPQRVKQAIDALAESGIDHVYLTYEVSSGTQGGTFTSGAWRTRPLNTEVVDNANLCSLSSNQVTLEAGTYYIAAKAVVYKVNHHQLRWRNVTDSTTAIESVNHMTRQSGDDGDVAPLEGVFTISSQKTFELQHRCAATRSTDGMGVAASFDKEVYATVNLLKIG
jgi:hypothetical protein